MKTKSLKEKSLRLIEGGKSYGAQQCTELTHKDIKELLARFAEAILVDQKRVDELPPHCFHPLYDRNMWRRNREDHVHALVELSMTVEKMPKRLLKKLSQLAVAYRPEVVKQPLRNLISDLATRVRSPELYETATLLFNELIEELSVEPLGMPTRATPAKTILEWFDYDDPIKIAGDVECEYVHELASRIEKESEKTRHGLAAKCRSVFIRMLIVDELCNDLIEIYER